MTNFEQQIRNLSPEQLARLFQDLPSPVPVHSVRPSEYRLDSDEPGGQLPPASCAQQRFWFLQQMQPESAAYHAQLAWRLRGPLNLAALEQSLRFLVDRHEILRTTLVEHDGELCQQIAPAGHVPLEHFDLRPWDVPERDVELKQRLRVEHLRPFDLASGPVLRATLFRMDEHDHVLCLCFHHGVADGWSMGILQRELAAFYQAGSAGKRLDSLAPLPRHYADFAIWQRRWLAGPRRDEELQYWRKQLRDLPPLNLPTSRPRPEHPSDRGAATVLELPQSVQNALESIGRPADCTLFMTLLAAFQVLLSRYTGQTDIAVGTPIANRSRREWEGLAGFFVNSLVLRTQLEGDPTFLELLARVREVALAAYMHQDLPFERLVEELRPERRTNRNPLFQVMFGVHHQSSDAPLLEDLTHGDVEIPILTSRFDLELNVWEHPQGLRVVAFYSTDLFDEPSIARLLGHFEQVLLSAVASPDRRISELGMLTDAELLQISSWNEFHPTTNCEDSLHERFERQARESPQAVAVTDGTRIWSYEQLNQRADQLAVRLREFGVGPEIAVALLLNRSVELVAALLGVLKAGGAYVPLDPEFPADRCALILKSVRPAVLITESSLRSRVPDFPDDAVICVDDAAALRAQPHQAPCARRVRPDNLAYVMFTSGSTGEPKGVGVTHRNVLRLFDNTQPLFQFDAHDVWTMFHSSAFDFSVWELWGALLYGGRLVVVPWTVSRSAEPFSRLIAEQRVTILNQTPASFAELVREGNFRASGTALRYVLFGGDRLDPRHLTAWFEDAANSQVQLVNMYGITETTVHATWLPLPLGTQTQTEGSPIGVRLSDLQIFVLDAHGNLAPVGVPGEIYVGGAGLSRGYWQSPALTAERFLPHPFSKEPGSRLYRTGDRARWRMDGSLEFLGRCDRQVKIRGVRIEPGEIEDALRRLPEVGEAVVVAQRRQADDDARLVAYITLAGTVPPAVDRIQSALRRSLIPVMIPETIVVLPSLPQTAQGKLDRRALPAPDVTRPDLSMAYVAPRTPVERAIAEVWCELLKLDRGGVYDNFFDLGGHSLQAARVIGRLRGLFGAELSVAQMFETPVLKDLAASLELALGYAQPSTQPPLQSGPRNGDLLLSFAQQRLWFVCQMQAAGGAYHIPLIMDLHGQLDVPVLQASLNAIVQRHAILRSSFPNVGGRGVQRIAEVGSCPLVRVDLQHHSAESQDTLVRERAIREQEQPFDLEHGPVLRGCLLQLAPERHVLLLTLHHLAADGWSIGVLRRELTELYDSARAGRDSRLPHLPVQYADFSRWQREMLQGPLLERLLAYWQQQLADVPRLCLPADRPRSGVISNRGRIETLQLPAELLAAARAINRECGTTLFMTLLAAFDVLLGRYSGQRDVAVGTPIANRGRSELEPLIGFFVNTLVIRTRLDGRLSFRELLRNVRETALAAYAHQDLPFERLVEDLQPERSTDQNPLFEVMFAVQNAPLEELRLSGLEIRPWSYPITTTRFDLQWDVFEHPAGLQIVAYYREEQFKSETIRRLLEHYQVLLERVLKQPDRPLAEISLLSDSQQMEMFETWNATAYPLPARQSLAALFEAQVERTPEARAVTDDEHSWTYAELNVRANRAARRLAALGVGPEIPVGLSVDRSASAIAALLGIIKAGGVYVPLDPQLPRERWQQLRALVAAPVVILPRSGNACGDIAGNVRVIYLDDLFDDLDSATAATEPRSSVHPDQLAYVLFTSGSTGTPNPVGVSHRAVIRLVHGTEALRVEPSDVVAHASHLSFDAATFEIWGALLHGAELVVVPRDVILSPRALSECLLQRDISVLFLTPASFQTLIRLDAKLFGKLRCLLIGGDVLDPQSARDVLSAAPPQELWNMYGPTECTTFATSQRVTHVPPGALRVPIGKPIANTQVYLLDEDFQPVPQGATGEIFLGGFGLARGYVGRAALTAARFVPHPFARNPGERLYRTGDLARFQEDGTIDFLGRLDHQVKLRGFRIELDEIRSVLRNCLGVQDCCVLLREDSPGDKRLAAYVLADTGRLEADEQQRLIEDWRDYYDTLYGRKPCALTARPENGADQSAGLNAPTFNIVGWNSSFTGLPLSIAAMWEQVNQTITRVLRSKPARVLEIGCGTGLLLFRLAPQCERYYGTDISRIVLESLRADVRQQRNLEHVELWEAAADDLSRLPLGSVDTVVLNSVIQYFPSLDYLRRVLQEATRVLAPGGAIFVGDVRNYALWELFQTAVEVARSPASLTVNELRERVVAEMAQETELLVHPQFFHALSRHLPGAPAVMVEPKRGRQQNELTQFRYDVTLQSGISRAAEPEQDHDARVAPWSVETIRHHLEREQPESLRIRHVSNSRVAQSVEALCLTRDRGQTRDGTLSVGEIRDRLYQGPGLACGIDPEDLWQLGTMLPYDVHIDWSAGTEDGRFDVTFRRLTPIGKPSIRSTPSNAAASSQAVDDGLQNQPTWANAPLAERVSRKLAHELRDHLRRRFPDYMLPAIEILDEFPLTPHGKLDLSRFPPPSQRHSGTPLDEARPRTGTEQTVSDIWCDVLRLGKIGLRDSFFDLGGHSLMAMQVITRLREAFGIDLPVRALFESPTVEELSRAITERLLERFDPDLLQLELEALEQQPEQPEQPDSPRRPGGTIGRG